jgi:hypothetical protein
MERMLLYRPSPAMVVALIALFVAMGGVSYGLATGSVDSREIKDNTIRTKDIRNGHVRTRDVRNNNLRGEDILDNTLTGTDVDEGTLGAVPNAINAINANIANSANSANTAGSATTFAGLTPRRFTAFTLTNGQTQTMATIGPFTLTATCVINQANTDVVGVNITTSQDNSALDGDDSDGDFDTGETLKFLETTSTPTGTAAFDANEDGTAIAPDGTEILGQGLYVGVNVLDQLGVCRFGGTVYVG